MGWGRKNQDKNRQEGKENKNVMCGDHRQDHRQVEQELGRAGSRALSQSCQETWALPAAFMVGTQRAHWGTCIQAHNQASTGNGQWDLLSVCWLKCCLDGQRLECINILQPSSGPCESPVHHEHVPPPECPLSLAFRSTTEVKAGQNKAKLPQLPTTGKASGRMVPPSRQLKM